MINFKVMKMQGLFILFTFLLCFLISSAKIEIKTESNFSILSKTLVHIIKSCGKHYHAAVINKRTDESVSRHLNNLESIAIIFQDDRFKSILDPDFTKGNGIVDLFVISVENNSVKELVDIIFDFNFNGWWNTMMPHFIINGSYNGCKYSVTALRLIWEMNILNGYYICFNSNKKPFIYTFNPYSNQAPHQWRMIKEISDPMSYMAFYGRPYNEEDICEGFDFDRTKCGEKTPINVIIPSEQIGGFPDESYIIRAMKRVFNVSITESPSSCADLIMDYEVEEGLKLTGVLWCTIIIDGLSEFEWYMMGILWSKKTSYPTSRDGLYIVSSNQRYLSPVEKIHSSFNFLLILRTTMISIVTYLVILFTNSNRRYLLHSFTTFEIVRLWIGNSLNTRMDSQYLRLFFSLVFIYFLMMQATLQGDLVDGLSKTKLEKNVNLISDLRNDHKIFITDYVPLEIFKPENIETEELQPVSPSVCVEEVLKNPSSVCVTYYGDVFPVLKNLSKNTLQSLHLSTYPLSTRPLRLMIPPYWPLKTKFNNFLKSIDWYGINAKTEAKNLASSISDLKTSEYVTSFNQISLDSVSFFFYFWIVGITLSFICFVFETFNVAKKYIINCIYVEKKKVLKCVKRLKVVEELTKQKASS